MKKLKVLFLSLLALTTIVSCSKDDDNNSSATLEAKWQISQEGETLTTLTAAENEGNCGLTVVEIAQGGVFKVNGFDYVNSVCTPYNEQGTWTKKDNTLTIKYSDNETVVCEIIELTESTLKLKETDSEGTWYSVFTKK